MLYIGSDTEDGIGQMGGADYTDQSLYLAEDGIITRYHTLRVQLSNILFACD